MSKETFNFVCTTCTQNNKTVEAVKYCIECSGYCCQSCTETHKIFPTLKCHSLLEVSDRGHLTSGDKQSFLELPTERCSIHKAKVVDMYCEHHEAVGCYVCIAKDHKSCPDSQIHCIPDMIDTIYKLSDIMKTDALLKDMVSSLQTKSMSKDSQLEILVKAKGEALRKVNALVKALAAILSKIAVSSRKEIEAEYKRLEADILEDKQTIEDIYADLKQVSDKLTECAGNRAQRFVCTAEAQRKMIKYDSEIIRQEVHMNANIQLPFVPNQELMDYAKSLQSVGQVQTKDRQTHDLCRIKESRDISIKLSKDSEDCCSFGCCLTPNNQLYVTDANNKKLKRIHLLNMSIVDHCTLDSDPYGVCSISEHEVAVACQNKNKIQFVSIQNKMIPTRQLKMSHWCYGVGFKDDKLYVTDWDATVYTYDMDGICLSTITHDIAGNKLFNPSGQITISESKMFIGGGYNGLVCLDGLGKYVSTVKDNRLNNAQDVCVDVGGNVFVVGCSSHNIVQFSEAGQAVGVVVKESDGLQYPRAVCFHQGLNRMFVTMHGSDVVKMYQLL